MKFFLVGFNLLSFINNIFCTCRYHAKNITIEEGCTLCLDSSRDGYTIMKCKNDSIQYETCLIGTRCVEDEYCEANCQVIAGAPCFITKNNRAEQIYDGCKFCDKESNSIMQCRGYFNKTVRKCSPNTICLNIDCENVRCENDDIIKVVIRKFVYSKIKDKSGNPCYEQQKECWKTYASNKYSWDGYCLRNCPGQIKIYSKNDLPQCANKILSDEEMFSAPSYLWFGNNSPYSENFCDEQYCLQIDYSIDYITDYRSKGIILPIQDACHDCAKNQFSLSKRIWNDINPENKSLIYDKFNFTFIDCTKCDDNNKSIVNCKTKLKIRSCLSNEICIKANNCTASCENRLKYNLKMIKNSENNNITILITVAGLLFFLFTITVILYVYCLKKKYVSKDLDLPLEKYDSLTNDPINSGVIIISENYIQKLNEEPLGKGAFGVVYKGILCFKDSSNNSSTRYYIAIKELKSLLFCKLDDKDSEMQRKIYIEEMLKEAKIMSKIDHPNVLPLYGICLSCENVQIITPYRRLGSLNKFLNEYRLKINGKLQLHFCHQIASGMTFLTSLKIVHGDLSARNVLVACDTFNQDSKNNFEQTVLTAQISDFGLAQMTDNNTLVNNENFPLYWAAIECLKHYLHPTKYPNFSLNEKTDVWAFGVTVWEIFTFGQMPYNLAPNIENKTVESTYSQVSYELNQIISGENENDDSTSVSEDISLSTCYGIKETAKQLCNMFQHHIWLPKPINCWVENPDQRKHFSFFEKRFSELIKNPDDYVKAVDPQYLFAYNFENRAKHIGLDPVAYGVARYRTSYVKPENTPLL